MTTHTTTTKKNKDRSAASSTTSLSTHLTPTFQFQDNRPEAAMQRKLQQAANSSPQVAQLNAYQKMANNSPQVQQTSTIQAFANTPVIQRAWKDGEWDEVLHGGVRWFKNSDWRGDTFMFMIDDNKREAVEKSLSAEVFSAIEGETMNYQPREYWEKLGFPPPKDEKKYDDPLDELDDLLALELDDVLSSARAPSKEKGVNAIMDEFNDLLDDKTNDLVASEEEKTEPEKEEWIYKHDQTFVNKVIKIAKEGGAGGLCNAWTFDWIRSKLAKEANDKPYTETQLRALVKTQQAYYEMINLQKGLSGFSATQGFLLNRISYGKISYWGGMEDVGNTMLEPGCGYYLEWNPHLSQGANTGHAIALYHDGKQIVVMDQNVGQFKISSMKQLESFYLEDLKEFEDKEDLPTMRNWTVYRMIPTKL